MTDMKHDKLLALEIGGTNVGCIGFDQQNNRLGELTLTKGIATLEQLKQLLDLALVANNYTGISISLAAIMKNGLVEKSPNIPMITDNLDLAGLIENWTGLPCRLYNDATTFVTGVMSMDRSLTNFYGVIIGTGYGGDMVMNGKIIGNSEPGHIKLVPDPYGLPCGCGRRGCPETLVSGLALATQVRHLEALGKIQIPNRVDPGKFLSQSREKKEPWAMEVYSYYVKQLVFVFANLLQNRSVDTIVLKGGSIVANFPFISKQLIACLKNETGRDICVQLSPDPMLDSYRGAAVLFREEMI